MPLVKLFRRAKIMTRLEEEAPANSVPAAAVRREGLVLFGMTGRKGHVGSELVLKAFRQLSWRL